MEQTWHCEACGTVRDGHPFTLHVACPALWTDETAQHPESELLAEQCVIGGDRFFLSALLVLPVLDAEPDLEWTIWVELAEDDFLSRCNRWFAQNRADDPPVTAHLAVTLAGYSATIGTPGLLHTRALGLHALFTPTDPTHTLTREHSTGISESRVLELAHASH